MKGILAGLTVCLALVLGASADSSAKVEIAQQGSLPLERAPLDLAASADGRRVFVLQDGGEVLIYSADGKLVDQLAVEAGADRIAVSPRGERLFLSSSSGKKLHIADLDYIREINTGGSPFKGAADAPVVVAVFDDFQ